jgi:stage V sporulation protein G
MQVTDVRIFPVDERRVKAYVSVVFDGCFIVRDVKIIEGDDKFFVAMPSKKMKDGSFRDTVHPLNNVTRQMIEDSVLGAYRLEVGG